MKIIIGGAGDVGCYLAGLLVGESHEITVIDYDISKLDRIEKQLDIMTYKGDLSSFELLKEANVDTADIFIAITDSQNTNLISSLIAKKLGARKVISRVKNSEYLEIKNAMMMHRSGIDVIISPDEQAAYEIVNMVETSILTESYTFGNRSIHLFTVLLTDDSPIIGSTISEVLEKYDRNIAPTFMPVLLIRTEEDQTTSTIFIKENDTFQIGDRVYFLALESARSCIYKLSGRIQSYLSDIIILGGGKIGSKAAKLLRKAKHRVKIIEYERERAEELADELLDIMVLEADGRDTDLMVNEGIGEADAFIAVTGRSETNMVACLLAKSKGVKKNISLVDSADYTSLSQALGIDSFINKKQLTANAILKYVRKGKVLNVINLYDSETILMEFRTNDSSVAIGRTISDLNLSDNVAIAGVIRNGKGIIINDDFVIEAYDRVIVFCPSSFTTKIESLF